MTTDSTVAPTSISQREAFLFWLKLGFVSFGGPAGQIALMHHELVEKRRWLSEKRFLHALNYCMVLPGPEAQQLATYIGWLMHKTRGGIIAGSLFVLPSLLILIILTWLYLAFGHTLLISGLFYGIKPAITALVLQAAYRIGSRTLKNPALWLIAVGAFLAIFSLHIPFPAIVLSAGCIGYYAGRYRPTWFNANAGHQTSQRDYGAAYLADNSPIPAHARFRRSRFIGVLLIGGLLWLLPLALLNAVYGWYGTLTQMAWFFTKAALLTFGGAYAVLPYVWQGAVNHYGWLSANQMMDGLALGETTPGPLIMVVAFVGFVGGYGHLLLDSEPRFWAGTLAACVVTWFTFLPSFIFILAGAPFIETTHNKWQFTAPLTAITAAVVGVIVNLALFFAYHVFWPHGWGAEVDVLALLIAFVAALALFKWQRSVIEVILLSGGLGLLSKVL